jgi:transposase
MRKTYPSDISRAQFEKIESILTSSRKKTKPRQQDLYDVFCGILYVLKSGCQWRMLPSDFPKWTTVYSYFRIWKEPSKEREQSLLEACLKKMVSTHRANQGRQENTSFCIIDAQSVKNSNTAAKKGYDAGKKVSGIKRHIAVDTQGLPHAIAITTADVTDRAGALQAISTHKEELMGVKNILADGGYSGENFAKDVATVLNDTTVEIVKRNELHCFVVIPKRWIVERSFAWLDQCRRLWKNCERQLNTSLQMTVLAFLKIILLRS